MARYVSWIEEPYRLTSHVKRCRDAREHDLSESRSMLQLFYNRPAKESTTSVGDVVQWDGLKKLGFNLMAEALGGARSQICKPLKSRCTTVGATFETVRAIENFNRLLDGLLEANKFATNIAPRLVIDGALCGAGYGLWEADPLTKNLVCSRLDPLETEISSDGTEAWTVRSMPRRRARAVFGNAEKKGAEKGAVSVKDAINSAKKYRAEHIAGVDSVTGGDSEDNIAIYEAWALPMGDEPGRHVIALDANTILVDEKWELPVLPVFKFTWDFGFREGEARSLGRTIAPYSYWLNAMTQKLHDALKGCVPTMFYDEDAFGEDGPDLTNVPFQKIAVPQGATKPEITTPNAVNREVTQHIQTLREGGLREAGVSEQAAAGTAPPQFKSGLALQEWKEIIATRLSPQHQQHEAMYTESGRIVAHLAPRVYASKAARVQANATDLLEEISWKQIGITETDQIVVQFTATGASPGQIAGKLEILNAFKEGGVVDELDVAMQFQSPDLKPLLDEKLADRRLLQHQIAKARDDGELIAPMVMQDHKHGAKTTGLAYMAAFLRGIYPAKNMQALLRLHLRFQALANKAATTAAPAPLPANDVTASPSPLPAAAATVAA